MLSDPNLINFLVNLLNSFSHDDAKKDNAVLNLTEINTDKDLYKNKCKEIFSKYYRL